MPLLSPKVMANEGWCTVPGLSWLTHNVKLAQFSSTQQFRRQCLAQVYERDNAEMYCFGCWRLPQRCLFFVVVVCLFLFCWLLAVTFVFAGQFKFQDSVFGKKKCGLGLSPALNICLKELNSARNRPFFWEQVFFFLFYFFYSHFWDLICDR